MEELCGFHSSANTAFYSMETQLESVLSSPGNYPGFKTQAAGLAEHVPGSGQLLSGSSGISDADSMVAEIQRGGSEEEISCAIRAKIACHPLYPKLLHAYIDCQKVGAPPGIAKILDNMRRESEICCKTSALVPSCVGADPELDHFMETYCEMLVKYKSDLSKPFDEATTFLNNIKMELFHLCNVVQLGVYGFGLSTRIWMWRIKFMLGAGMREPEVQILNEHILVEAYD